MVVRDGTPLAAPFLDIRGLVAFGGERGLLSMAFPPDYATSGRFYVCLHGRNPAGALTIAEYRTASSGDTAMPPVKRILISILTRVATAMGASFSSDPTASSGSEPAMAAEPATRTATASASTLLGKLLRIDPHGTGSAPYTIPVDNPFSGQSGRRGEVWAYGLRNPWRFSFDRQTGDPS